MRLVLVLLSCVVGVVCARLMLVVAVRVRLLMSLLFVLVVIDDVACVWLLLSLFLIGVLGVGVVCD